MMHELNPILAEYRVAEARRQAERAWQLPPAWERKQRAPRRRPTRLTIEVTLPPDLQPEQVDRIFANLARSLSASVD